MRVPRLTPRGFRRLTFLDLVLLVVVIVTGAAVRLTDSGLGCSDWPRCDPERFVSIDSSHQAIEQFNRLFSGAIGVPIALTIFFAHRREPRRRDLVLGSWAMMALFLANAVVGGISVLVELAWVSVMGHFLLAIALVGAALTTFRRAGEDDGRRASVVPSRARALARVVYAGTVWVLVAGTLVTAAGPHGGDESAERLAWPITDAARLHAVSVDVLVAVALALVALLARDRVPRPVLVTASFALGTMVAQGVLGYVQYFNAIPEILVAFHVAGAVLVFSSVHWLLLSMREVVGSGSPTAHDAQMPTRAVLPVG